jgi:putative transposase
LALRESRTGWAVLPVLGQLEASCPRLEVVYADGGYQGFLVAYVDQFSDWRLEIVHKPADQVGFCVQEKRWVVERTFAWLGKYRRMSKDYEFLTDTGEAMLY